jgi:phytanoyl-CoA hydroxylase
MTVEQTLQAPAADRHLSPFGGFWTDRANALDTAQQMLADGRITYDEHVTLSHFILEGYAVIRKAVSDELISGVHGALDKVFSGETPRNMSYWGPDGHHNEPAREENMMQGEAKLLDLHWVSEAAQNAIFAPKVRRFLELVFGEPGLAFQSLYFKRGSEQGIHQDTAFVPVADAPLNFVASWIALEDVQQGTGELLYVPRSHRLPDLQFLNGSKKCTPQDPAIKSYTRLVKENYEQFGLQPRRFLPFKGDVLFWAADLCHGGAPITSKHSTRRSLVTHYCPASRRPEYAMKGREYPVKETPSGGYVISQT